MKDFLMGKFKAGSAGALMAFVVGIALPVPAHAVAVYGTLSSWETAAVTWSETTTFGTDSTPTSSFTLVGGPGVTLASPATVNTVPSTWATWCCGYTGQVLDTGGTSATWTFASPVPGFGIFAEPNLFETFDITVLASDGTSFTQAVLGDGGAKFYGFIGGIAGITATSSTDFALGDAFVTNIPEPEIYAMMAIGLALMGFVARRRSGQTAAA